MWRPAELLEIACRGLQTAAAAADAEQSSRGIDALSEVQMHPALAEALTQAGYGVIREQGYPAEPEARPEDRDRERCDLVLLPSPGARLADPLIRVREQDRAEGTLFASVERERPEDADAVPVSDAYWLEVKVVGQNVIIDGFAQPNGAYSSQLVSAIAQDVRKLSRDEHILSGGLLLALFTSDEQIARHDLNLALHRCLDKDVPLGHPEIEHFPITDRIGNTGCLLTLIPAR